MKTILRLFCLSILIGSAQAATVTYTNQAAFASSNALRRIPYHDIFHRLRIRKTYHNPQGV
jgi:hypothetical protein